MITQLDGTVSYKGGGFLVLNVEGVGYKVYVPQRVFSSAREKEKLFLWTHLAVKESVMELYGFASHDELIFFEMLIGISGIGPKSALAIMNLAPVDQLKNAIAAGDAAYLTKVSGIGKRTAAKIILELKEKLDAAGGAQALDLEGSIEALDALRTLGYSAQEAREVLQKVGSKHKNTNEKIKEALKLLSER